MKKLALTFAFLFVLSFTANAALPKLNKSAESVKPTNSAAKSCAIVESDSDISEGDSAASDELDNTEKTGLATLPDGQAYVGVTTYLALRDEPFGEILTRLYNNEEVIIVGREGDWYEIESEKGSGWVYGKCVFSSPNSRPSGNASDTVDVEDDNDSSKPSEDNKSNNTYNYYSFTNPGDYSLTFTSGKTTTNDSDTKVTNNNNSSSKKVTQNKTTKNKNTNKKKSTKKTAKKTSKKTTTAKNSTDKKSSGKLQDKIVKIAKEFVKKYSKSGSFPYYKRLKGGRIGCAQVATTVLKKAGALKQVSTGCRQSIKLLQKAGWKKVKAPPYKAGDVIVWTETNKKKSKGPTHIGIIMESGKNVQAMSNSSRYRKPRLHKANYAKQYCVLRKA